PRTSCHCVLSLAQSQHIFGVPRQRRSTPLGRHGPRGGAGPRPHRRLVRRHTRESSSDEESVWEYVDKPPKNFFSAIISSVQRLRNGNRVMAEGAFGRIFEVTAAGETVWEYLVPYFAPWQVPGEPVSVARGEQSAIFRAFRYAAREQSPWL